MNAPLSTDAPSDAELIGRIRSGDRAAFLSFYDRHVSLMLAVAMRILADRREAEDVLQDVFAQVWQRSARYDPQLGSLAGWTVALTRNKAVDRLRASSRRRRLVEEAALSAEVFEAEPAAPANEQLFGKERAERVRSAVAELSSEQREAIELAFFGGLTQSEIAARLNEPLGTIKARIRRGMLRLRERLGEVL